MKPLPLNLVFLIEYSWTKSFPLVKELNKMPEEKEFIKKDDGSKIRSPKSEDTTGEQPFDFRQMKPKKQKNQTVLSPKVSDKISTERT